MGRLEVDNLSGGESKGMFDDNHFLGLGLDEENESDMHEERIKAWTAQVRAELGLDA